MLGSIIERNRPTERDISHLDASAKVFKKKRERERSEVHENCGVKIKAVWLDQLSYNIV